MERRIIDVHAHLGDIFHENKSILFKRPGIIAHPDAFDPFKDLEESGFTRPLIVPDVEAQNKLIDAGQYRVWDRGSIFATSEMMDRCGYTYFVNLPIMPNTSFDEGLACSMMDSRYLTFSCPDFDLPESEMMAKLRCDIELGARGLKFHPIIQNVAITDERCEGPIRLFGELGLPITYHCGVNDYYKADSPYLALTNLEFGALDYSYDILKKYPDYLIIPAHAGGTCGGELEALGEFVRDNGYKNVYVEMSHRGSADILKAMELFGEDKVMFATDWPFDTPDCNIRVAEDALGDDPELLDMYLYQNAARILGL